MTPSDRIHAIWDELADFGTARFDEALDHLLASLCGLVDAQNANWTGAVRMPDILPDDPVHGWRARAIRNLRRVDVMNARTQEQAKNLERGSADVTTIRNVALAGTFRANRVVDLISDEWFDSEYYKTYFRDAGISDAIWVGFPVNADAEVYFGVFREDNHPRFSEEDRDTVAAALRGLKWFHRAQLLTRGLLIATSPLTPTECGVLQELLTGKSEKRIAGSLGRSHNTTHDYVTSIFRKFGVNNRAGLMALWLGYGT